MHAMFGRGGAPRRGLGDDFCRDPTKIGSDNSWLISISDLAMGGDGSLAKMILRKLDLVTIY